MKKTILFITGLTLLLSCKKNDDSDQDKKIVESNPTPVLFSIPGLTTESYHITFSAKSDTFYFMGQNGVMYCTMTNGVWSNPVSASFKALCDETPMLSPNGMKIFFTGKSESPNDNDIWVMDNSKEGWVNARNLGPEVNSTSFESGASVARSGNLYFRSARQGGLKMFCSKYQNNKFSKAEPIQNLNEYGMIGEPFVAPDESYLLLSIYYGDEKLYISFNKEGNWTKPIKVGNKINTAPYVGRPYVSSDSRYLYFTKGSSYDTWRIYKVDWKPTLDSLKKVAVN